MTQYITPSELLTQLSTDSQIFQSSNPDDLTRDVAAYLAANPTLGLANLTLSGSGDGTKFEALVQLSLAATFETAANTIVQFYVGSTAAETAIQRNAALTTARDTAIAQGWDPDGAPAARTVVADQQEAGSSQGNRTCGVLVLGRNSSWGATGALVAPLVHMFPAAQQVMTAGPIQDVNNGESAGFTMTNGQSVDVTLDMSQLNATQATNDTTWSIWRRFDPTAGGANVEVAVASLLTGSTDLDARILAQETYVAPEAGVLTYYARALVDTANTTVEAGAMGLRVDIAAS